ncbi:unnamed protein product [Rangifer tarandus platyrhynchus]|uniref:Uncharacterized protein n=1 Tax=Rangifer tarandus platyrhynchus TaxID=3082113 RepID=A0AC60A2T3_RANTA
MRSCDLLKGLEESLAFSKLCCGLCVVRQRVRGRSQQAVACSALLLRPHFGVEHQLLEPWSGALSGAKSVFDPLPAILRRMEAWPTFTGGYERCPWPGSAHSGAAEAGSPDQSPLRPGLKLGRGRSAPPAGSSESAAHAGRNRRRSKDAHEQGQLCSELFWAWNTPCRHRRKDRNTSIQS